MYRLPRTTTTTTRKINAYYHNTNNHRRTGQFFRGRGRANFARKCFRQRPKKLLCQLAKLLSPTHPT